MIKIVTSMLALAATIALVEPAYAQDQATSALPQASGASGASAQAQGTSPAATPPQDAAAPPASSLTINGSIILASEYRYRGVSYTDNKPAVQAFLTVSHSSGLYIGFFGSNLAGFGSYGGANLEADVFGGYTRTVGKIAFDVGVWNYRFPGTRRTDFVELYAAATIPLGPAKVKAGFYYAPKQTAIGRRDDLSSYSDFSLPIKKTPITLRAHLGYTTGKGSTISGPTGHYFDYLIGADYTWRSFTFNLSYVDTTINRHLADQFYYIGGKRVINGAALVSITAAF